jgi:hypothetical protein
MRQCICLEAVHDGACWCPGKDAEWREPELFGGPICHLKSPAQAAHLLSLHRLHNLICAHTRCPQVDPAVSAAVHYVSSLYYKAEQDFAEFYKSSLQYLAFVSSDQLEHEFKLVSA